MGSVAEPVTLPWAILPSPVGAAISHQPTIRTPHDRGTPHLRTGTTRDPARRVGRASATYPAHTPDLPCTYPRQCPHTGRTAQRPQVRALRAAFPARSPLLPARTRSLRAASAFLTTPPHKAERAWSGTLRLYYTSKQTTGETNPETYWGKPGTPPGPAKPRPGSRFRPPFLPPQQTTDPPCERPGKVHGAQDHSSRRTGRRGNCRVIAYRAVFRSRGRCMDRGGTPGNPPKPVFPNFSPHPPSALPPPEATGLPNSYARRRRGCCVR